MLMIQADQTIFGYLSHAYGSSRGNDFKTRGEEVPVDAQAYGASFGKASIRPIKTVVSTLLAKKNPTCPLRE